MSTNKPNRSIKVERHTLFITSAQVAGIWVEGNDDLTGYKRSLVVHGKNKTQSTIEHYYGCYDPLCYPLFYPNGESGWHNKIARRGYIIKDNGNDPDNIVDELQGTLTHLCKNAT